MKWILSALLLAAVTLASAQLPFDCIDALNICDGSAVQVNYDNPLGAVEEDVQTGCEFDVAGFSVNLEENTVWLRYRFTEAGDFYFTITPEVDGADIDFTVYRPSGADCQGLEALRCMFSGENVGTGGDDVCMGPTGLADGSADTAEGPGCQLGDDNFLAPVAVAAGDELLLAVQNFSQNGGYTIEPGGTAVIGCGPVATHEVAEASVRLYPNPVYGSEPVRIEAPGLARETLTVQLLDAWGRLVRTFRYPGTIDTAGLPKGVYWVRVREAGVVIGTKKLLKM